MSEAKGVRQLVTKTEFTKYEEEKTKYEEENECLLLVVFGVCFLQYCANQSSLLCVELLMN